MPDAPIGTILLWPGDPAALPSGWVPCDGTGGTRPLTDRYVPAAGGADAVGANGDGASAALRHGHGLGTTVIASKANNHDWSAVVGMAAQGVAAAAFGPPIGTYDGQVHDHPALADSLYNGSTNEPTWAQSDSGSHVHPLSGSFTDAGNARYPASVALLFIQRIA